jgi:hypothetical protein
MRNAIRITIATTLLFAAAAAARAEVCVTIDHARDTLSPSEQSAALLLVNRQFELAGEQVVPDACPGHYSLSHIRLASTIVVTMAGPGGQREGIAHGMDDLPALYSQMVRSIVTGRPMTGFNVIDRTNVTEAQTNTRRLHTDSVWYARIGYGSLFGDSTYATPGFGFGYRAELDSFAIDASFLNFQYRPGGYYSSPGASTQSLLKVSGLYFLAPRANRSTYFGGGLSYGRQNFGAPYTPSSSHYRNDWEGSGLQGELTAGYELGRATSLRLFLQADAVFPFYEATAETFVISRTGFVPPTIDRRYAPSLIVSIGVGR